MSDNPQNNVRGQLPETGELAQIMLDATPLGITLWDVNGNMVDCNMEAARVVGIHSKREYFEKFATLAPEYQSDGQKTADKLMNTLTTALREGSCRVDWEHKTVDGELIPFDITAVRLRYKERDFIVSYAHDMREINAANAKMREADERAQILLGAAPVSCTLFDGNNKAIDCNAEALKMLNVLDKDDYLNNHLKYSTEYQLDGTLSAEKAVALAQKAMETGYLRFEWTHLDANEQVVPCEVTLVRVRYKGQSVIAGYERDLREFKAMVKEMQRAEIAEESNKSKSRFLAAMSHEIRTPMNVILGVTEIQLQDESLPPHLREAFMQVYNSSDLLLGIINDILDFSKIEAGRMEFTPVKYGLASLINDAVHLNMMRNSKPIAFELDVAEQMPAHIFGDELRIKQILNNLLSNAYKFTDEGRIKLAVSAEEAAGEDITLLLTVSDTGQGMSKEQMSRLFTEYTRFNLETNRAIEGTGLGMNITRRLITLMGGTISVDSGVARGTTVNVRLPQKRVGDERIGRELAENLRNFRLDTTLNQRRAQFKRDYMPYGKVLIVDDVESNLYVGKGLMAPYGLTIETAGSGLEAIEKIKSGKIYDVIFMDHMMPKIDGIEATSRIRALGYAHPIVALTANAVIGQADIFLRNGFDDFISKPIDIRQLNAVLNNLVRDKQPTETLESARREKAGAETNAANPSSAGAAASAELLAVFAHDAGKALKILESTAQNIKNLSADDMRLFTISVHGLKSALSNIGETALSQTALALEKAGGNGDKNAIDAQLNNFINALNGVMAKAEAENSRARDLSLKDKNPKYLREQLAVIASACKDYDKDLIDETLKKLKKMSWTAATHETLDKIAALILNSDFNGAAETAESAIPTS
ncbi:MAG: response regulator [Chitinispirillales bacterium]|jgi:signal transduction histidine kinase/CheY-like chemotaxis protein/HPt (histidine-containing phosphotransfer) domain-containing protein|nr:response regulator [Chitinispirillales bacterium]